MIKPELFEEVKKRLIKTYNPVEMYLFGSHVWGTSTEESDLDLLIIIDHIDPKERYKIMAEGHRALLGLQVAKDILVLSKEEFAEASENKSRVFYTIKRKGQKIYARA